MPRFKRRPVIVEARQYTKESCRDLCAWLGIEHDDGVDDQCGTTHLNLDWKTKAQPGDWIVRDVHGERHVLSPEVFATAYEAVES